MDPHHVGLVFRSAAAGSLLVISTGLACGGHLFRHDPDRPVVSPACHPAWGYHQTCWRRFAPVPPCDGCGSHDSGNFSDQGTQSSLYVPQPGVIVPQYIQPTQSLPLSVLPGQHAGNSSMGSVPSVAPSTISPSATVPPLPPEPGMSAPSILQPQSVQPVPGNLPPLPSGLQPKPDYTTPPAPQPGLQQSRYGSPSWIPQNTMSSGIILPQQTLMTVPTTVPGHVPVRTAAASSSGGASGPRVNVQSGSRYGRVSPISMPQSTQTPALSSRELAEPLIRHSAESGQILLTPGY